MIDDRIHAPFSDAECRALTLHQTDDRRHPLTCPHHSDVPLEVYWSVLKCEVGTCDYRQTWAPVEVIARPDDG